MTPSTENDALVVGHVATNYPTAICPVEGSHAVIVDGWCSVCGEQAAHPEARPWCPRHRPSGTVMTDAACVPSAQHGSVIPSGSTE